MFQRILVPFDGSTVGSYALDQALRIARRERAVITALCIIDARVLDEPDVCLPIDDEIQVSRQVVPPSTAMLTYQAWAEQIAARAQERGKEVGVDVQSEIVTGIPYREVISRCSRYDLLVMGVWDTPDDYPGPFLAGTTYWHIITHTRLPTLCIRGQSRDIQRILVAYDDSREAVDALQLAVTWCRAWELSLVVLTMQPDGDRAQAILRKARERAHPLIPTLVTRSGDPTQVIPAIAQDYECDLIALGVHCDHGLLERPNDSTANAIIRISTLPVLLSH